MNSNLGGSSSTLTYYASGEFPDWLGAAIGSVALAIIVIGMTALLMLRYRQKAGRRPPPLPPR